MEKLPDSILKAFWENLTPEWKKTLKICYSLPDNLKIADIREVLNSTDISINVQTTDLDEKYINLYDIQPLKYFTELESITLQFTTITTLSNLGSLKKLRKIFLSNCKIIDVTSLSHLTQIEELDIWSCDIENITWITKLEKLRKLVLIDTKVTDISCLNELKSLRSLDCWGKHSYEIQLDCLKVENPKCEINRLKQSFELSDFLNNNPDADISDFGFQTIDPNKDNDKWSFEDAPDEVKEHMLFIKESVFNFLKFHYYPIEYDNQDVEHDRITTEIDDIEFFIISSNRNKIPKIHLISCEYWNYLI